MEALLPATTWVLGVDEHTAMLLDLAAGRCASRAAAGSPSGPAGRRWSSTPGSDVDVEVLVAAAQGRPSGRPVGADDD
jgi:hypothetical protein